MNYFSGRNEKITITIGVDLDKFKNFDVIMAERVTTHVEFLDLSNNNFNEIKFDEEYCKLKMKFQMNESENILENMKMIDRWNIEFSSNFCEIFTPSGNSYGNNSLDSSNYDDYENNMDLHQDQPYMIVNDRLMLKRKKISEIEKFGCMENVCVCFPMQNPDTLQIVCPNSSIPDTFKLPIQSHPTFSKFKFSLNNIGLSKIPKIRKTIQKQEVIEYYLQNNLLDRIDADRIPWSTLRVLDISRNLIERFDESVLDEILTHGDHFKSIAFNRNPFRCECDNWSKYKQIFNRFNQKIEGLSNIFCEKNTPFFVLLDHCERLANHRGYFKISVILILSTIIGSMVTYHLRKYATIFQFYFHRTLGRLDRFKCRRRIEMSMEPTPKKYDAFVSYSPEDEDFVQRNIIEPLEHDTTAKSIRLCLAYRDWTIGRYVPDQIVESIERSRCTIIVLSRNFLSSNWSQLEFQTAYNHAKATCISNLLVILLGDLETLQADLDPTMRKYLKMHLYVRWDDKLYLEKLRFSLRNL